MAKSNIDAEAVSPDDLVIAIMGPTGSGKSTLIDTLMEQKGQRSGTSLNSCTDKVQAVRVPRDLVSKHISATQSRVVLVDTPGFDDTKKTDTEILKMIGNWLAKTYGNKVKLAGILYLHRISDNRMSGSPLKNLRMFGKLCGDTAARRVVLVSSMWDRLQDQELARRREAELKDNFWRGMLDNGASIDRSANSSESAWRIVRKVVQNKEEREALLLQEEMVDLQKHLNETEAGKALYTTLQKLLSEQKETIRLLADQASQANPEVAKELEAEHARLQKELDATFVEIKRLKIPFGRRIMMFFKFKKARGRAV
ncbi:hypothetical protein JAAARDRAFT_39720 [Jaapia argillacea MUCL 33604]|uniref:Septin-type G domain-containing protein n=1 Tax=Jaapia argillacea MUCL 33604 TaxID=933084 RepID=A0A067PNX9_9AGAM|nr:hypothetical protein JAAARDRAFT_39720 [Jaapia argillacea MUCL 33604]